MQYECNIDTNTNANYNTDAIGMQHRCSTNTNAIQCNTNAIPNASPTSQTEVAK
jgi:hypothetical protein